MDVNNSDRNGRALEYAIVMELSKITNATLTNRANNDNLRDKPKFDAIAQQSPVLSQQFIIAGVKISNWISNQFVNEKITIDRLPDSNESVTDITITSPLKKIELSLKHNHLALKHPRPYSIAQACGYAKNSTQDISHRNLMRDVDNSFRKLVNGIQNYNNCPKTCILNLYNNVYEACQISINNWANTDKHLAKNLFGFIVNNGFFKVIVNTGKDLTVKVQDFLAFGDVSTVKALINHKSNYLTLIFNNGWEISLRVHTAATKISKPNSQLSLKFDAQRVAGSIYEINI